MFNQMRLIFEKGGKQMSEKMTKCKSCGNDLAASAKACPNCGAKNKKPIFKKWWFWVAIVVVLIGIIGAAGGGDDTGSETKAPSDDASVTQAAAAETKEVKDNEVGSYQVEIKNARITEDYEGKPVVVITYGFTNNSDNPASFGVAIEDAVFQNDIGLNEALFLNDNDSYSSDNQIKEIKTGASLDVEVAYELNDSESDIVVEVKELFGWNDDIVTRTFSIN